MPCDLLEGGGYNLSIIIPINPPAAAAVGGGNYIIVAGNTTSDISGKTVTVSLSGTDIFSQTIPSNVQSVAVTITEAGVYTVTVGSESYSVNVASLTGNYLVVIGDTSTSRPPTVFKTAGTFSYTVPSGVKKVYITGAGGGGGGNYFACGGGGDACFNEILTVTPGQTYTITVGSGGNGTTSQTGNGSSGGASKFGSLLTLAGGGGAKYDSTITQMYDLRTCVGAAGGIGGGGFRNIPALTDAVAYGTGFRTMKFHTPTISTSSGSSHNALENTDGNSQYANQMDAVGGGIGAANLEYYKQAGSSYTWVPNGCSSLGFGALNIHSDNRPGGQVKAIYGGGGAGYTRFYNTSESSISTATKTTFSSTYLKGAAGCMIISEEPITWAQMWELLGEKYYPSPADGATGGWIIV